MLWLGTELLGDGILALKMKIVVALPLPAGLYVLIDTVGQA
jgi:hypothetical protein